jgi:hypothetical protein
VGSHLRFLLKIDHYQASPCLPVFVVSGTIATAESFWCMNVWQLKFRSTVEADPVCAVFDREHPIEVTVPAAKNKPEDAQKQFHKSCASCRRSQLPLASSQSSRDRTLARARAIAQSAAP